MFGRLLEIREQYLERVREEYRLRNLASVNLGFDRDHVITVWIDPSSVGYPTGQLAALYRRLVESVEAVPGVRSAAAAVCGLASNCGDYSDGIAV
jgi:hypothetical protein